jgi:hypothetical protein
VVDGVRTVRQPVGVPRKRPAKLHADKGYDYPECRELLRARNIVPRIARKGIESPKRLGRHRYVVERCTDRGAKDGVIAALLLQVESAGDLDVLGGYPATLVA